MPVKAMITVCRFVIGTLARNQLSAIPQNVEKAVSTDLYRDCGRAMHEVMKLSGSEPRLSEALFVHEPHHLLSLEGSGITCSNAFVICLSGNSDELASPADTQVLDFPLGEDLPDRFFTTETPNSFLSTSTTASKN